MTGGATSRPRVWWRRRSFLWGCVAGVASPFAAVLCASLAIRIWLPDLLPPQFNVDVVSLGRDVSRHGGHQVVITNDAGTVRQICRDTCDDLHFQAESPDNSYGVNVLGKLGDCVACGPGAYVTNGYGAPVTRFRVAGTKRLDVMETVGSQPPTLATQTRSGLPKPAAN